jgi:aminoglycoside phosphotransferase (APT) family kinase protein
VLDPDRFAAWLQAHLGPEFASRQVEIRGLKVRRIYYKPGRSCRLTFEAKLRGEGRKAEQLYFAKILPDAKLESTFRRAQAAPTTLPEFGPAVALVRELGMVLWAYPNDPNLPGLATLASRPAVEALLRRDPAAFGLPCDGALVDLRLGVGKYVPGQRCGYRYRVRWSTPQGEIEQRFYGKAYQEGLGRGAYDILAQLAASAAVREGRLRIPMPYGYDAEREIVWQEMLPGASFAKEASAAELAALAAPVASALAAFHAAPLSLGPGLGLEAELEELRASTAKLARAYPQHAGALPALERRLVHAVADLEPVPAAPVHGSFKTSHMFDAGGRVAFIDFDGAGIGDPTYDVGRFLAHLAVTALDAPDGAALDLAYERFRDAYARRAPWGWADRRVRWYTAALLLSSQAYKCVKRMAPERVAAILTSAEAWFPEP